jgi:O-antigen ligase
MPRYRPEVQPLYSNSIVKAPASRPQASGSDRWRTVLYYIGAILSGVLVFRPALGLTASDWFFFGALVVVLYQVIWERTKVQASLPRLLVLGVALFAVGGLASSLHASHRTQSALIVLRLVYVTIVWFWVGAAILRSREQLLIAASLWTISAALSSSAAIFQLLLGNVIPGTAVSWGRMPGLTQHVNDLGGLTAIALVPAVMLATRPNLARGWRALSIVVMGLVVAGLILSGSVTGFVSAAVGLALWFLFLGRRGRILLALGVVAVVAVAVAGLQLTSHGRSPLQRLEQVTATNGSEAGTFATRIALDEQAIQVVEHNPLVGVGLDAADARDRIGNFAHNMLLGAWMGAGLLGIFGIVLALAAVASVGLRAVRAASDQEERILARALAIAFVVFLVFGMAVPLLYQRYAWMPAALLVALRAQQLRRASP